MIEKTVSIQIETQDKIDTYKAIIEALEKQIPKKPKDDGWLYCPVCGKDILSDHFVYCPDCGQRIDWRYLDEN